MAVSDRIRRRLALGTGAASLVLMAVGTVVACVVGTRHEITQAITQNVVVGGSFVAMGLLLTLRAPRNPIGWFFSLAGFLWSSGGVAFWPQHLYDTGVRDLGLGARLLLGGPSWPLLVAPTLQLPLLYLPDGRLRSPRWRPVARATVVAMVVTSFALTVVPGDIDGYPGLANPFALPVPESAVGATKAVLTVLVVAGAIVLFLSAVLSVVGLVRSYRRAHGVARQQLRWVMVGGVVVVATLSTGPFATSDVASAVQGLGFAVVPVTMAVAVLRHGLYELDRIISRTVSYAALSALLVAVYAAVVAFGGTVGGGSSASVAAATLVAAAAFRPLRSRLQAVVDRRFNRARYDAAATADRFSARLREQLDPESVASELTATVGHAVQPATASVWLASAGAARR